jgi:hypothetical protein
VQPSAQWQSYLPFVVIAIVFLIRLRTINRERRMHLGRLLVGPTIVALFAVWLLITATPDWVGLAIAAGAMTIGALAGWQRARLMTIAYDPQSDTFTVRQSPVALAFLIGIIVVRRVVLYAAPVQGFGIAHAMWPIDGLIGFGLGMVMIHNGELWLRARRLRAVQTAAI